MTKILTNAEFLKSLTNAGRNGLTYGINDTALKTIVPEVKRLRSIGNHITQEFLNGSKASPFGRRIKFVLERADI
jgi:hypothetical protein